MSKNTILFDTTNSLLSDYNDYDIEKIDWVQKLDSNNGTYTTSFIRFDLEELANASYFSDFSNSYFFHSQDIVVKGLSDVAGGYAPDDFSISLKASIMDSINAIMIKFNDIQVTDNSQSLNRFANFQLLHMSEADLKNIGDLIGFFPDTPNIKTSGTYAAGAFTGANSQYAPASMEYNNIIIDQPYNILNGYVPDMLNKGRLERMKSTSFNPQRLLNYYGVNPYGKQQITSLYRSHTNGNTTGTMTFTVYTLIPFPLLHPIFGQTPVCRGVKLNMTIQMNIGNTITCSTDSTTNKIFTGYSLNSKSGSNVCPIMISPLATGAGDTAQIAGTSCKYDATSKKGTIVITNEINTTAKTALYMPQITFTPEFEKKYCEQETKTVQYLDYVVYTPQNLFPLAAGNPANQVLITNSVVRPRDLIIIPEVDSSANGGSAPSSTPFSSSPFTTAPYSKIYNFNVALNGKPIWQQTKNYTYEMYVETMSKLAIDGRQYRKLGISSGLLSKDKWENGYTYYYVDLDHAKFAEDDNIGKSVNISFTNSANVAMDYYCILTRQREFDIDVSTGKIVQKL